MDSAAVNRVNHGTVTAREVSMDWGGNSYLLVCGRHVNGWFIAIPNWGVCAEAACPTDTFYNAGALSRALGDRKAGQAIAEAVCQLWEAGQLSDPGEEGP